MFEFEWTDFDRETVGEHRRKKELDRRQQGTNKHDQEALATRNSVFSDIKAPSLFKGFGWKKSSAPSNETKNPRVSSTVSTVPRTNCNTWNHKTSAEAAPPLPPRSSGTVLRRQKNKKDGLSLLKKDFPATRTEKTGKKSLDQSYRGIYIRSNKPKSSRNLHCTPGSMVSKATQTSTPTTNTQITGTTSNSFNDPTIQGQAAKSGIAIDETANSTSDTVKHATWTPSRVSQPPRLATPQTPVIYRRQHFSVLPEIECSTSSLIDDWYQTLQGVAAPDPMWSAPNAATRRGQILVPPNAQLTQAGADTPTRPPIQVRHGARPIRCAPVRFSAYNPDQWKPPPEWQIIHFSNKPLPIPARESIYSQEGEDEREAMALLLAEREARRSRARASQVSGLTSQDKKALSQIGEAPSPKGKAPAQNMI